MILILDQTQIQNVILTTQEVASILYISVEEDICIGIGSRNVKITRSIYDYNHPGIGVRRDTCFPGRDNNVWRGFRVSVDLWWSWANLSWSDQLVGALDQPQQIFSAKILNPKDGGRFTSESLTTISHEVNPISLRRPCLVFKSCV